MTVFVNPTAASNGAGTLLDPKNTWAGMNWSSDDDFAQVEGAPLVGGVGNALNPNVSGTAAARKTLRSYEIGTGNPTRNKAVVVGNGATQFGINLANRVGFWNIQDFDVSNIGNGSSVCNAITAAVSPVEHSFPMEIVIERCNIHDGIPGTDFNNGISLRGRGNVVRNCNIWNICTDGIIWHGWDVLIEENRIWRMNTDGRNLSDCINGSSDDAGAVVRNNYMDGRLNVGKQVIIFDSASGTGIAPRLVYGNTIIGGNGAVQGIYTNKPAIIYGNIFIDALFQIRAFSPSSITGNLFMNTGCEGQHFGVWCEANGSRVINNTFINSVANIGALNQKAIQCESGHSGNVVMNNLIRGYEIGIRLAENAGQVESNNYFEDVGLFVQGIVATPALGVGSRPIQWSRYTRSRGELLVPFGIDGVPMLNPLGNAGVYAQGVRLMGGRRLDPARVPVGAFAEGRY
jgi:hypothetical protein